MSKESLNDYTEDTDIGVDLVHAQSLLKDFENYTDSIDFSDMFDSVSMGDLASGVFGSGISGQGIELGVSGTTSYWQSKNFVAGSTGWRLDSTGILQAVGATLSGTITATTGFIGGWTINATSISDTAGLVGMSSAVTVGDDIRFWAGHATPASAPFKVTEAGALTASSATITGALTTAAGSSINGTYLTSASVTGTAIANATITATNITASTITANEIANATITATQIANATITTTQISGTAGITGGQIASATITSSNISGTAGITGAQIASATITSSNISNSAGITGSQIASATITGTNLASATITATNIASLTITASQIANLTITGTQVAANTLTSGKLSIPVFIVSGGSFTNNSPIAGSVAWTSVTIDYNGTTNTITNGDTASKYIVWSSASPTVLTGASSPPTATTSWLVGINTTGTYTSVWDMPQINGQQIMDATVGGTQIANNTIQAVNIANGVITSTQISGTAGITGGQIANTTITATNIANNTITANQITNATLTATQIANGAITPVKTTLPIFILSAGTFTDNSPIAGKVAWSGAKVTYNGTENTITDDNSISTYIIWDSTAPTTISGSATVPTSATQFLIGINSSGTWTPTWNLPQVNGAEIQSGTVTATQIANNTVSATQIANATITTTQISATAGIVGGQIANNTITATQIANATITGTQIASATITASNIANTTITATQIAALTITATEIANLTITSGKINDVAIDKLTTGTLTASTMTVGAAGTDGYIQSYGWDGTANGFQIKGGATPAITVIGGTITGTTVQTGTSGQRIRILGFSSGSTPTQAVNSLALINSSNNIVASIGLSGAVLNINPINTSQGGIYVANDSGLIQTDILLQASVANSSSTARTALFTNLGSGNTVDITNSGTGMGLLVDVDAGTGIGLKVTGTYGSNANNIFEVYKGGGGAGNALYADITGNNTIAAAKFKQQTSQSTNFWRVLELTGGSTAAYLWVSNGTDPNGVLSGTTGAVCFNCDGNGLIKYCAGGTTWTSV